MKLISFKHLVIGVCMFAAAGMALILVTYHMGDEAGQGVLHGFAAAKQGSIAAN